MLQVAWNIEKLEGKKTMSENPPKPYMFENSNGYTYFTQSCDFISQRNIVFSTLGSVQVFMSRFLSSKRDKNR